MKFSLKFKKVYTREGYSSVAFCTSYSSYSSKDCEEYISSISYFRTFYRYGVNHCNYDDIETFHDNDKPKIPLKGKYHTISYKHDITIRLIFTEVINDDSYEENILYVDQNYKFRYVGEDYKFNIREAFRRYFTMYGIFFRKNKIYRLENNPKIALLSIRTIKDIDLEIFAKRINESNIWGSNTYGSYIFTDIFNNSELRNLYYPSERNIYSVFKNAKEKYKYLTENTIYGKIRAILEHKLPVSIIPKEYLFSSVVLDKIKRELIYEVYDD